MTAPFTAGSERALADRSYRLAVLEVLWVGLLFTALTAVLTYPLSVTAHRAVPSDVPDTHLFIWTLAWDTYAFLHQPLHIFDANIFYPNRHTLAYSENLIGSAFFAAPVLWITGNPILAMNVVSLLSCVLSGLGAYVLGRRVGMTAGASVLAGIIFAFSPPRFLRFSQLHLTAMQWIPFALASLQAYLDRGRRRDLLLATAFATLQVLSTGHGGVMVVMALVLLAAYRFALGEPVALLRRVRDFGVAGALLAAPCLLFAIPYRLVQVETGLRRDLSSWDTPIQSFIASPTPVDRFFQKLVTTAPINDVAGAWLFPGVLVVVLAASALSGGAAAFVRERRASSERPVRASDERPRRWRTSFAAAVVAGVAWAICGVASVMLNAGSGLSTATREGGIVAQTGTLVVERPGSYEFGITADETSRILVDDVRVFDRVRGQQEVSHSRRIRLTGSHRVMLEHVQRDGQGPLGWQWSREGDPAGWQPIPAWLLSPRSAGYSGALVARTVRRGRPIAGVAFALAIVWACAAVMARHRREWFDWAARHRRRTTLYFFLLAALCAGLALGPPYGLWQFVYWLPGLNLIRRPSRFMVLGLLAFAALAGIGADRLTGGLRDGTRRATMAALAVLLIGEFWMVPWQTEPFRIDISAADRWIAQQPGEFAIAEVPVDRFERYHTTYMMHSMAHWQKTVHGYSGFRPPLHDALYELLRTFPTDESLRELSRLGVKYVIVHADGFPPDARRELEARLPAFDAWLAQEYADADARVYSIRPPVR